MADQYDEFERAGEPNVRDNLARDAYIPRRAKLARAWPAEKDRGRINVAGSAQARISRSSKNAAWVAAVAAIVAAVAALVSAYYSMKGGR